MQIDIIKAPYAFDRWVYTSYTCFTPSEGVTVKEELISEVEYTHAVGHKKGIILLPSISLAQRYADGTDEETTIITITSKSS